MQGPTTPEQLAADLNRLGTIAASRESNPEARYAEYAKQADDLRRLVSWSEIVGHLR
jgi:hypothetical protein